MLNVNGCKRCIYLTKDNQCKINFVEMKGSQECLEAGDCDRYEEPEIDERIMDVIKQKVNEATPEELDEALEYINKQLNLKKQSAK